MKKRLSLFMLAMLTVLGIQAQMIAYSVQSRIEGTPGEPTVVDLQGTTGTDFAKQLIDNDGNLNFNAAEDVACFPIGFDFGYNSQVMKYFVIGTDGFIQLSPTETITTSVQKAGTNLFSNADAHDVIGLVMRNGFWGFEDTEISYWLEGVEGSRALAVQWKNVGVRTNQNWEQDVCGKATVLIRLYEKSGNIEIKVNGFKPYDDVAPGSNNFMRIGILGDANDRLMVLDYEGTQFTAQDKFITYSATAYPQDGTVYTFVAPEPCVAPTVAPSDLVLTSTTTQITGTFTAAQGDHFLVLATTEAELSEKPADGTKYKVGDELGNARVIANVDRAEFVGPNDMAQGTFNVFVIAYNSLCMDGPLYCNEAGKATIAMKPEAPASLSVNSTDKTNISLKAEDSGAQMVIAMTAEQHFNSIGQGYPYGEFGTPAGTYEVGQEIDGGGKIVYIGSSVDALGINDLESGKPYFFRAWSTDGNGGYSSEYLDINAVTAAELPWEFDITTAPTSEAPIGWTEEGIWSMNTRSGYFYNQVNAAAEGEAAITWRETSDIWLGEGSNWLSVEIAATEIPVRFATDWSMLDGDEVAVQVTTDGVEYKNILTLNKDNMPDSNTDEETGETTTLWKNGEFHAFKVNFSEYAGQKVKVRLYIKRQSKGQVQFKNFKIDGTLYGIVGTIPGLTWDDDLFMAQDKDNKNIYTATLPVTVDEIPAEAYEYKLRSNQNWDGYQLPAEGNQYWMPTETGSYTLVFTADLANHQLSLSTQRPYQVSFKNEAGWTNVYAYTWIEDGEGHVIAEPSGAWPGTKVESTFSMMSRKFIYNFSSEQQPQYIIWNNADGYEPYGEEPAQTDNYVFVNGKEYSVYPEITSVALPGNYNGWSTAEISAGDYPNMWQTTIGLTEDTEFKLLVNGNWLGYSDVTIEAPEGWVVEGSENNNLKLMHSVAQKDAYFMVAYWMNPSTDVKSGWLIAVEEGDPSNITTGVRSATANAAKKQTIHNLAGQQLQQTRRGVNIVNGQKRVVKK